MNLGKIPKSKNRKVVHSIHPKEMLNESRLLFREHCSYTLAREGKGGQSVLRILWEGSGLGVVGKGFIPKGRGCQQKEAGDYHWLQRLKMG